MTQPTKRDLQDLRRLLLRAGGIRGLNRWAKECREQPKVGRPRTDPFDEFSVNEGPEKGLYTVRYKMGGEAYVAVVSPNKRWKPEKKLVVTTPRQAFIDIAKTYGREHHSLGAFANRLGKKFSEILRELKRTF